MKEFRDNANPENLKEVETGFFNRKDENLLELNKERHKHERFLSLARMLQSMLMRRPNLSRILLV
jgi:hypothetical protein